MPDSRNLGRRGRCCRVWTGTLPGRTFVASLCSLLFFTSILGRTRSDQIYLLPLGPVEPPIVRYLAQQLAARFGTPVRILRCGRIPTYAWRADWRQYSAPMILDSLAARHRNQVTGEILPGRLVGVMAEDISAPGLDFVFGQADMIDRVAVVSYYRFREGFVRRPDNRAQLLTRLLREMIHEVGHTYGLGHCPDSNCVMHFSRWLADADRKSLCFCSHCRARLEK